MDTANLVYSPHLWFNNGDIVLKAENTLFRVTRGILAYHSPVFLQMVLHSESNTFIEGCRVLILPDSAEDTSHFLQAIHDSAYYDPSKDTPFSVISGVLRMSTKYEVHPLRQMAVRHLQRLFPPTLEAWDQRSKAGNDTIQKSRGRTIAIINLALETNHHVLLPSAMAYSWAIGLDALLDGAETHDRKKVELDLQTKRTCLLARDRLTNALRSRLLAFIATPSPARCQSKARCDQGRLITLSKWEHYFAEAGFPTPFRFEVNWTDVGTQLCRDCVVEGRESFLTARWVLWDELPSFFGLESWEVLSAKADLERRATPSSR
ncbi:hypothetical protein BDZ89DRAFT_1016194 [Hymenopellis radicata]|nr:hypothetical protein BDZ89DRAFT_1016194 [Hymenopellis radicata]